MNTRIVDRGITGVSRITKQDVLSEELRKIAKAGKGSLTPELVLKNAKQESSPIHDLFDWDDSSAGEKFRLLQAQTLIRTVKVKVIRHDQDEPILVREYASVTLENNGSGVKRMDAIETPKNAYVPINVALDNECYRNQLLADAFRDLCSFRRKYEVLKELSEVFKVIDKLSIPV